MVFKSELDCLSIILNDWRREECACSHFWLFYDLALFYIFPISILGFFPGISWKLSGDLISLEGQRDHSTECWLNGRGGQFRPLLTLLSPFALKHGVCMTAAAPPFSSRMETISQPMSAASHHHSEVEKTRCHRQLFLTVKTMQNHIPPTKSPFTTHLDKAFAEWTMNLPMNLSTNLWIYDLCKEDFVLLC